jgi:DNA-binding NarL/FixJ family response regulator
MTEAQPSLQAIVADDSVLLRDGLVRLLEEAGIEVLAAVEDAAQLMAALEVNRPDLVVVDVRMPPTHTDEGIRAALTIRRIWPAVAVVVLSHYVEERYAAELLAGQVSGLGYLLKDRVVDVEEFIESLRRVAAGGSAIDPEVISQILHRSRRVEALKRLTPREREVLTAMAEGLSNSGIGQKLVISDGAVEKHISNVLTKLDLEREDSSHRRVLAVLQFLGDD